MVTNATMKKGAGAGVKARGRGREEFIGMGKEEVGKSKAPYT